MRKKDYNFKLENIKRNKNYFKLQKSLSNLCEIIGKTVEWKKNTTSNITLT